MHNDRPMVLTTTQVAIRLQISEQTARMMCEDGRFPGAFRLSATGGRSEYRIPIADVVALMQAKPKEEKPPEKLPKDMTQEERKALIKRLREERRAEMRPDKKRNGKKTKTLRQPLVFTE